MPSLRSASVAEDEGVIAHRAVDRFAYLAVTFAAIARQDTGDAVLLGAQRALAGADVAGGFDVLGGVPRRTGAEDDRSRADELPPRRLAPWTETQAHSRPRTRPECASRRNLSVSIPPIA